MDSKHSILNRPQRSYNGRNATTLDSDHSKEEARIQALRQRREKLAEERRVAMFGNSNERAQMHQQIQQNAQYQNGVRSAIYHQEQRRNYEDDIGMRNHNQAMLERDIDRERQRREQLRQIQEENRRQAMVREEQKVKEKVYEDRRDRAVIQEALDNYQPNVF